MQLLEGAILVIFHCLVAASKPSSLVGLSTFALLIGILLLPGGLLKVKPAHQKGRH